jgi:mercuric ion transport protein
MVGASTDEPASRIQRLTIGGVGAAFGLATCCALPMFLASVGVGTAWLGGLALFAASHRPLFLVVAVVGLASGPILLWLQRKTVTPTVLWTTSAALSVGLVLLYFSYTLA